MTIGLSVAVGLVILVGATDILLNRVCYNPYQDPVFGNTSAFQETVIALIPSAYQAYTSGYEPGTPRHFSRFSQRFSIQKPSVLESEESRVLAEGSLRYCLGKAEAVLKTESQGKWIFTQADYLTGNEIAPSSLEPEQYYIAQVGFPAAQNTDVAVVEAAQALSARGTRAEILRAMLQTSDDPEAVALGVAGEDMMEEPKWGERPLQIAAYASLLSLAENSRETEVLVNSGLFGDLQMDFPARFAYAEKNGIRCIGLSVFAKGADLQAWLPAYGLRLVHVQPDAALIQPSANSR